jgi:hypothetical protein
MRVAAVPCWLLLPLSVSRVPLSVIEGNRQTGLASRGQAAMPFPCHVLTHVPGGAHCFSAVMVSDHRSAWLNHAWAGEPAGEASS